MAVQIMTYRDLPEEVRQHAGAIQIARIREKLADRTLSPEQRQALLAETEHLASWIQGTLEMEAPASINHEVSLEETVGLEETAS